MKWCCCFGGKFRKRKVSSSEGMIPLLAKHLSRDSKTSREGNRHNIPHSLVQFSPNLWLIKMEEELNEVAKEA